MIWPFRRNKDPKAPASRLKMFLWPFVIFGLMGAIQLLLPLDEAFHGLRDYVRARKADGSIVVVAIDQKTVDRFGDNTFSRAHDARLIDALAGLGAGRIYFDRTFTSLLDEQGDNALVGALDRHRGKVHFGVIPYRDNKSGQARYYKPNPKFIKHVELRSLAANSMPLSFSLYLFRYFELDSAKLPSISTDISHSSLAGTKTYRPDWSIQYQSVPTVSMIDVLDGKVTRSSIAGRDIVVGFTAASEPDFHHIIGQGWFPGVYSHAIGAQTLKESHPRNLGWLPAFVLASLLSLAILRTRRPAAARRLIVATSLSGLAAPFAFDHFAINLSLMPGYLLFGFIAYRTSALLQVEEVRLRNAGTLLPTLSALREEPLAGKRPIVAMRIRNYAAICASFTNPVEDELVTELVRRLRLPGEGTTFYQAEDVIYWLSPTNSPSQLIEHLEGLARIIESHFLVGGRKIDVHVSFGIDNEQSRPVGNRIGRALLAADTAATQHQLIHIETSSDDDSAWELSLMSELDAAIDSGDIWVALQPQFELKTDRITGAEALVRWQHPNRGAISPEAFILAAETHNRIERLTMHVLELAACDVLPLLKFNPQFRLSVNVSASLLENQGLVGKITAVLDKTGFPSTNLTLEVTESAPFAEKEIVTENLDRFASMGIELSIDDYGTGNATLAYLRSVPCQEIKIDRRFVANICTNASDLLLVESTIELAHGLGRRVIAEGIEDPETLELLRSIGCDMAQGFYVARPMRIDALEALLGSIGRTQAA